MDYIFVICTCAALLASSPVPVLGVENTCSEEVHGGPVRRGRFRAFMPEKWRACGEGDAGKPLFLTPLLRNGSIEKAIELSRVEDVGSVPSYSGYLTVNEKYESNMFFWFFPAQENPETAPVVLWLQGGPGGSSLFGLFVELGPLMVTKEGKIVPMPVTWNKKYSLLYIDNPVGTGFSFTNSNDGYARNEADVARDLYSCLTQFFTLFAQYQKRDFYITGESYAGKYVPSISQAIIAGNAVGKETHINFRGMAIGDGWTDPVSMYPAYTELMHQMSLIDDAQADYARGVIAKIVAAIRAEQFMEAFTLDDSFMGGDLFKYPTWFFNATGSNNYFNILYTVEPPEENYFGPVLVSDPVRRGIHVGNMPYGHGSIVEELLREDMANTSLPALVSVLDADGGRFKVMLYNGQLDVIVGVPLTETMCAQMPWAGRGEFYAAKRAVWRVAPGDAEVAGYVRTVRNLQLVVVRGAGHMVPFDQPARTFDLISRFIDGTSFDG